MDHVCCVEHRPGCPWSCVCCPILSGIIMKYPVSGSTSFKYTVHFNDCIVSPIFKESERTVTRLKFVIGWGLVKGLYTGETFNLEQGIFTRSNKDGNRRMRWVLCWQWTWWHFWIIIMEHCFVWHIVQCLMYSYTITLNTIMSTCLHLSSQKSISSTGSRRDRISFKFHIWKYTNTTRWKCVKTIVSLKLLVLMQQTNHLKVTQAHTNIWFWKKKQQQMTRTKQ